MKEKVLFLMTTVYMSEDVNNMGKMDDSVSCKEAMKSENSLKWCETMDVELRAISCHTPKFRILECD
jgi:hypothetical protein